MPHCVEHLAPSLGQRGPVHLDHPWEAAELLAVDDDHSRRCARLSDPCPSLAQPPLGVPQAVLDALDLAADQQRPGIPIAEHWPDRTTSSGSASIQPARVASPPACRYASLRDR